MPRSYRSAWAPPLKDRRGMTLPDAVKAAFGDMRCPCCGYPMRHARVGRFQRTPADKATVAHDFSVARGGSPHQWFFACHRCNNDQGVLDLVTWARKLVYGGDPRATRVAELAAFVRRWVAAAKEEEAA